MGVPFHGFSFIFLLLLVNLPFSADSQFLVVAIASFLDLGFISLVKFSFLVGVYFFFVGFMDS